MPVVCKKVSLPFKGAYLLYGIYINMMYTEGWNKLLMLRGEKEAYAYSGASVTETKNGISIKGRIMQKMN